VFLVIFVIFSDLVVFTGVWAKQYCTGEITESTKHAEDKSYQGYYCSII